MLKPGACRLEICRGYGVFPIMVGHSDKTSTFASSEAFFAAHLIHCLAPWHRAWTQRIDEMLLDGRAVVRRVRHPLHACRFHQGIAQCTPARWLKWAS